jgi:hypothetical protein
MTAERPMQLDVLSPDGSFSVTPVRRFRWAVGDGWLFEVSVGAYVHIPLALFFNLRLRESNDELLFRPGPRLVFGASEISVVSVEVLDMDSKSPHQGVDASPVVGVGADDDETQMNGRGLRATFTKGARVAIHFQNAADGRPMIKLEGDHPTSPRRGAKGHGVLPVCLPGSRFNLQVQFREVEVESLEDIKGDSN